MKLKSFEDYENCEYCLNKNKCKIKTDYINWCNKLVLDEKKVDDKFGKRKNLRK